jgi:aspartate/methionine/tyrosine aminotransferase
MDQFNGFQDDLTFCKMLLEEENVLVLPSRCFFSKDMFRVVICNTEEKFREFAKRMTAFCARYHK